MRIYCYCKSLKKGENYFPKLKLPYWGIFNSLGTKKRKKANVAIMGAHTASATAEKQKWCILNPEPHRIEKSFFPNMVMLYTIRKLLKSWATFTKES